MAIEIRGYPLNITGYTAEDARLYTATRTNGVFSSDADFIVSAVTNQPLQVTISKGMAWMHISEFEGVAVANQNIATLDLEVAHSLLRRIDRIIIRLNIITNKFELYVKTGIPSSSPIAQTLQRNSDAFELGIADILVTPTTATLTASNITDTRLNENLCGIMADGVTRIPTETLYNEWYAWFTELQSNAEEKARILQDWMDTFKSEFGENAEAWFTERDEIFKTWLNSLQEQVDANVGAYFFAFSIVNGRLILHYGTGIDPDSFAIVNGRLIYTIT